jgi:hypothetical protein
MDKGPETAAQKLVSYVRDFLKVIAVPFIGKQDTLLDEARRTIKITNKTGRIPTSKVPRINGGSGSLNDLSEKDEDKYNHDTGHELLEIKTIK